MKFRTLIFSLFALSLIATLFSAEQPFLGAGNYGTETLESVQGQGLVKLHGTLVSRDVQVTGSLIAHDAQIGALHILGEANLTGTTVKNESSVMGSLQAIRSTFEKPLTILSQKAVFTASHLEAITVQQDSGFKGKQVIELKQGSVINGPIHFESGKGEVIVFPGCQVLGQVTGGKIVKKS